MNFDMGEKEKQVCGKVRELFTEDASAELTGMGALPVEDVRRITCRWMVSLAEAGYPMASTENGRNSVSLVANQEQLAALAPALFLSVEVSVRIFGRLVARFGTEDQKNGVLPDLIGGKRIGAVALSENSMNIENDAFHTTGVSATDGFHVTGNKSHVVNGAIADWIAVAGKMDDREGPAFFLMKKESKGLSMGERLATLGYEGASISPMELDKCPVPETHVIHMDSAALQAVRMWEDQILTAASLGLMRRSFDAALQYAKTHRSGGKPIIAYQEVGFKLAEMLTLFQTSQLLAYRAAWMSESEDREAHVLAHGAKVFCAESAEKVTSEALQILGGKGYVRGNPAEAGYRDAKYLQIAGTSTEISRMKIGDWVLEHP